MAKNEKIKDVVPTIQYIANGTTTVFPFPFMVFKPSDVDVYLNEIKITTGFQFEMVEGIHGGNVVFTEAPIENAKITITRILTFETLSSFTDGGYLLPAVLNTEFNHLVGLAQQLKSDIGRCMLLPVYIQNVDLSLPAPVSGRAIIWNNQGTGLVNSTLPFNTLTEELNAAIKDASESAENSQVSAIASKKSATAANDSQKAVEQYIEDVITLKSKAEAAKDKAEAAATSAILNASNSLYTGSIIVDVGTLPSLKLQDGMTRYILLVDDALTISNFDESILLKAANVTTFEIGIRYLNGIKSITFPENLVWLNEDVPDLSRDYIYLISFSRDELLLPGKWLASYEGYAVK